MSQGRLCHMPFLQGLLRAQYRHFTCFGRPWLSPYSMTSRSAIVCYQNPDCAKHRYCALGHLPLLLCGQVARPMTVLRGSMSLISAVLLLSWDYTVSPTANLTRNMLLRPSKLRWIDTEMTQNRREFIMHSVHDVLSMMYSDAPLQSHRIPISKANDYDAHPSTAIQTVTISYPLLESTRVANVETVSLRGLRIRTHPQLGIDTTR
jgi:hypothetical protein